MSRDRDEPPGADIASVKAKLKLYHDVPVNTYDTTDEDLYPLAWRLMHSGKDESDGRYHWFCHRTDSFVRDLATFLLRLFAYTGTGSKLVEGWKNRLQTIWKNCPDCIQRMDEEKVLSKETFFGAFKKHILEKFWSAFEAFEVGVVVDTLRDTKDLSTITPSVLYLMLSKASAYKNPDIFKLLSFKPFDPTPNGWPTSPPPPGVLLLAVHKDDDIREWAVERMKAADRNSQKSLTDNHKTALQVVMSKLSSTNPEVSLAQEILSIFPFTSSEYDLWAALAYFLPTMTYQEITSVGLPHLVMKHLHDNGEHFRMILRSFLYILLKGGSEIWAGKQNDYPLVVFDSIKDNPSYIAIIQGSDPRSTKEESTWFLFLLQEYLKGAWDLSIFRDLTAKIIAFICDELQHERFKEKRPVVTEIGMKIIMNCVAKAVRLKSNTQLESFLQAVSIHADFITAVALSGQYDKSEWRDARQATLSFMQVVLTTDIDNLASSMAILSQLQQDVKAEDVRKLAGRIHSRLWSKFYEYLTEKDADAVSLLIALAARSAKLDFVSKNTVLRITLKNNDAKERKAQQELVGAIEYAVDDANKTLEVIHNGFLSCITRFADSYADLQGLVSQADTSKHLVHMLLSPVEDYNVAAQTLIGQAYDVDMRARCLRELLKAAPEGSLQGFIEYLNEFSNHAEKVNEACNLAKALVRTMTDVIEVLGNSPDGLLRDPSYIRRNSEGEFTVQTTLPKLWKAMTTCLAVIFRRTPKWALFYDNQVMVEWMRDALIFGRDLLERRHAFEQASLPIEQHDELAPRKFFPIRKAMIDGLQDVLLEVQAWLRLTDMELLYQSFALLKSLFQYFHECGVKPSQNALDKLKKFITPNQTMEDKDAKGEISKRGKRNTYLNPASLAELDMAIAEFDDDEVQIVSVKRRLRSPSSDIEVIEPLKKRKVEENAPVKATKHLTATKQSRLNFPQGGSSQVDKAAKKEQSAKQIIPGTRRDGVRGPKYEGSSIIRQPDRPSSPVSDSSSEESDTNELQIGPKKSVSVLASLTEQLKRKDDFLKKAKPERRQIKIIDDPMLVAQQERQRKHQEARRTAARMKPDISRLHSIILTWNYDHNGDEPPYIGEKPKRLPLELQYGSYGEYQACMEPLLMLECWAQIVKSKEEALEVRQYKIVGRSFVDDWLDLDGTSDVKQEWRLSPETDIVLLRHATEQRCIMAKVTIFKRTADTVQIGLRCSMKAFPTDPGLSIGSTWRLSLVFSLSTLHREYAALVSLQYYDRLDFILRPRLRQPICPSPNEIGQTMRAYQVNEPQAKAIVSSLKSNGFSLIQGPPGTGKTSTICGLVGAHMSTRKTAPTPILPGKPAQRTPVPKILICAPSNAAVDEVAKRLMEGVRGEKGQRILPKVIRVGADRLVNVSVKEITLDYLVEHKLSTENTGENGDADNEMKNLLGDMEKLKRERIERTEELKNTNNNTSKIIALEDEIRRLNATRISLNQRFNKLKDIQRSEKRSLDAARRQYRYEFLAEADVICCTLSGSGHELLEPFEFPLLIIDEAAQCVELSSLIPLKYQSAQCIMVGDPEQLPPTVLSQEAMKWQYDRSLFVRLHKNSPDAIHLLSIQYRMHPDISCVPSKIFYNGRLHDGPDMAKKTEQPWHAEPKLGVYKFFSASRGREEVSTVGHSQLNREEIKVIVALYRRLTRQFSHINFDYRVGIVSMYKQQISELRRVFKQQFDNDIVDRVDFNTVDGFQGQEKDIIILSCVRASPSLNSIGFLADRRRINVGITRSRCSLYIVGNAPTLQRCNETWKAIIDDAQSRSCLVDVPDLTYFTVRESVQKATPKKAARGPRSPKAPAPLPSPIQPDDIDLFSPKNAKTSGKRKHSSIEIPSDILSDMKSDNPSAVAESSRLVATNQLQHRQRDQSGSSRAKIVSAQPSNQANQGTGNSAAAQQKARKELEMFRQRKKAKNSVFIKK